MKGGSSAAEAAILAVGSILDKRREGVLVAVEGISHVVVVVAVVVVLMVWEEVEVSESCEFGSEIAEEAAEGIAVVDP